MQNLSFPAVRVEYLVYRNVYSRTQAGQKTSRFKIDRPFKVVMKRLRGIPCNAVGPLIAVLEFIYITKVLTTTRTPATWDGRPLRVLRSPVSQLKADVKEIKVRLLDPDNGTISRVNKNTSFRKNAQKTLWSIWVVLVGILGKLIFWN